ncbi:MAG: hypothetical protein WCT18_00615 [Patescibacteria group bacterium]
MSSTLDKFGRRANKDKAQAERTIQAVDRDGLRDYLNSHGRSALPPSPNSWRAHWCSSYRATKDKEAD